MNDQQILTQAVRSLLNAIAAARAAGEEALNEANLLLSSTRPKAAKPIESLTQGTLSDRSSSDEEPLRDQLTFEGKPIPASGSDAGDIIARARAFAAEQKAAASVDTDPE